MYNKALEARQQKMKTVDNWNDFMSAMQDKCIAMAPWCNCQQCEIQVKDRSKEESENLLANEGEKQLTGSAKTLCIPFEQPELKAGTKCFHCGTDATLYALWGRSY